MMAHQPLSQTGADSGSFSRRFGQALRRYFVTGLAMLVPVAVTLWLLVWMFNTADGWLGDSFGFKIPGLGLIVTVALILAVGFFTVHLFGRAVFQVVDVWLVRLPIAGKIYPAIKQLAQFLFSEGGPQTAVRRVVLVQYPRPGAYSLAFVTNESRTSATGSSQTMLTLLIPNPPSPFTGPIIFVPQDAVIPLELSIEDAVKLIVSGGVVASPLQASASSQPK